VVSQFHAANGIYNLNPHKVRHDAFFLEPWNQIAALNAPLAASRFISAALPLPRKYMPTCCAANGNNGVTYAFKKILNANGG
jgi:hypothetical protein